MNLVLVGYRGTGKSSVAALLGKSLGRQIVSLDRKIIESAGMAVPDIVAAHGWSYFRDLEQRLCLHYAAQDALVLDCGGGVVERQANITALRQSGVVFWLTAKVATIAARIGDDSQRPSLTGTKSFTEEIEEVLTRRRPLYKQVAHVEVGTDDSSVEALATTIATQFRNATHT
jgi:shikimate kinase